MDSFDWVRIIMDSLGWVRIIMKSLDWVRIIMKQNASGGGRTLDLRAMNPTRCQLRHRGFDWMPRAGFEPAHSFEYLNLSQAP